MKEIINRIFGDVGVELIVSIITVAAVFLWQKAIVPFVENLLYKGVRINGRWMVLQDNKTASGVELKVKRETIIEIRQKANRLFGTAESTHTKADSSKEVIKYKVHGKIRDTFVSIIFDAIKRENIAHTTFLVQVKTEKSMKGYRVFYGRKQENIDAISCILTKVDQ